MVWSSCLAFWHAIANSVFICLVDYYILGVVVTLSITKFGIQEVRRLAEVTKLAQVIVGIVITI